MATKAETRLEITQKLAFRPELQQAVAVLQLSTLELWEFVQQQLIENPMLELREEDERVEPAEPEGSETGWIDYLAEGGDAGDRWEQEDPVTEAVPAAPGPSLYEYLMEQLALLPLTQAERAVAEFLVGNLDRDGYLRMPLSEVGKLLGVPEAQVVQGLTVIQSLEPPGVGARDLRECLLLQLERLHPEDVEARLVVQEYLEDVAQEDRGKLARRLGWSREKLERVVDRIRLLNPRPGSAFGTYWVDYILPDVLVQEVEGQYVVLLNESAYPRLVINPSYYRLLHQPQTPPEAQAFLQRKFKQAIWLLRNLEQRRLTLYQVSVALVERQQDFFRRGLPGLKPLTLRDIAETVGVHESTVSRAVAKKYLQCSRGIFPLRFFFGGGVTGDRGQEMAVPVIKDFLKRLIEEEDPASPLSDQEVTAKLQERGIKLSRRTVAKYRTELGIPNAAKRRKR
ncbi:RNA polymerase factor sigma-54 [Desulfothermobacter acidiphilus]|uniref:RNA polymerase factor sigma-54 n=1 Tax=Desulfothermobacter acidiphilus TaxID=1938353 RepID=UPI003F899767